MTTSIRDLLDQVTELQSRQQTDGADAAIEARLVIGAASAALGQLDVWRPDWTLRHRSRRLADELRAACLGVQAGNGSHPMMGPHVLMAATADAVGTLCSSGTPATDRWAIAIAIADVVRHSTSTYCTHGPALRDHAVTAARTAAIAVAHAGLQTPPRQSHRGLIDLPIPTSPSRMADPLLRAAATAAEIEHVITRAATEESRGIVSIYELRALTLTFEHATRCAGAALGVPSEITAAAWAEVRQIARQLHDGQRPASDGPEVLLGRAAQLHHDLARQAPTPADATDQFVFTEILGHVANTAESLTHHVPRMAGRVYARADQFPTLESRVEQHLRREPFIANIDDLQILQAALRVAEYHSRQLAAYDDITFEVEPYPLTNPLTAMTAPGPFSSAPEVSLPPRSVSAFWLQ